MLAVRSPEFRGLLGLCTKAGSWAGPGWSAGWNNLQAEPPSSGPVGSGMGHSPSHAMLGGG